MPAAEKPSLEAVLDWAQVDYRPTRSRQMTHCPLHEDNTPSLSINLERQLWKCQSCGAGGDSYTMIMKVKDVGFSRAVEIATAEQFSARVAGGGDVGVPGLSLGRGVRVSRPSGNRNAGGTWRPSWRGR